MAIIYGRNSFIQMGEEVTWGTEVGPTVTSRIMSIDLQRTQERNASVSLSSGDAAFAQTFFDGNEQTGGSCEFLVYYENSGILLKAGLGAVATTGAGPAYVHTYTPTLNQPSLTMICQRGSGSSETFLGTKISSFTLSCEAGGEMTGSMDVICKTANTRAGAVTPTYTSGRQVLHFEASTFSFNGTTYDLRSMTLTVDNKLDRRFLLGSKLSAESATNDIREVTLECTADIESASENTLYTESIDGDQANCEITFTNSDNDIFEIKLFNSVIMSYSDSVNSVGRIERTWTMQGYSDTSNPAVHVKITNEQSSAIAN